MPDWSGTFLTIAVLAFMAGVYAVGYGSGKQSVEADHAQARLTLTSQTLPKLDNANRTFDAILYQLQQDKTPDDCPVASVIGRSIDLMPDPTGGASR